MKRITALLCLILLMMAAPLTAYAAEENSTDALYEQQMQRSGADRLYSGLPEEAKQLLLQNGITAPEPDMLRSVDFRRITECMVQLLTEKSRSPCSALFLSLGTILLCSMVSGTTISMGESSMQKTISAVGALCICTAVILPLCRLVERCGEIIEGAAGFMTLYVPVMTGLMVSASHPVQGAGYYSTVMTASELIGWLSSGMILPVIRILLGLSVTSSLSQGFHLSGVCTAISRSLKWIMNFALGIFVTILSAQNLITSSMDEVSIKAARMAMNSFIPVVGGVLSETVSTFSGSLSLLKSGTGVFVIIASACIFLPVLIECFLWRCSFLLISAAADMLGLGTVKASTDAAECVTGLLTAVLLTIMMLFIISTVVILMVGQ